MSENDLDILCEQSDTVDVSGNTNSTDSASGTETQKVQHLDDRKGTGITSLFQSVVSKIDKPRK